MINPEVREVFSTRAQIIRYVRRFFDERGFLEVLLLLLIRSLTIGGFSLFSIMS
jgi:lysyl-tRNA synthetase class II